MLSGNAGSQQTMNVGMGEIVLADVQVQDELLRSVSGPLSITIGSLESPNFLDLNNSYVEARIFYGCGGVGIYTPWFLASRGVSVPMRASHVRVSARIVTVGGGTPPIRVYGMVSEGVAACVFPPLELCETSRAVLLGETTRFDIPSFAKAVTVISTMQAPFTIGLRAYMGVSFYRESFLAGEVGERRSTVNAVSLSISNEGAVVDVFHVIWHLEF